MTDTTNADDEAEIEFTTDSGTDVTVTAQNGDLRVTVPSLSVTREHAQLTSKKGTDVLDAGHQQTADGETIHALLVVGDRRDEIEQLRADSEIEQTDAPLTYEVETYSKGTGSWGQELTGERLVASKPFAEMTDRQQSLSVRVDTDRVPSDAEPGDVLTPDDLLDDARTTEERDADALEEAEETGEEVVISVTATDCNDDTVECSLDHVHRIATPGGEIKTERIHTY